MALNTVPNIPTDPQPGMQYCICVRGLLNEANWSEWFGGLAIEMDEAQGVTRLRGSVADQAELYGLLSRLRNLGLALISVEPIGGNERDPS